MFYATDFHPTHIHHESGERYMLHGRYLYREDVWTEGGHPITELEAVERDIVPFTDPASIIK